MQTKLKTVVSFVQYASHAIAKPNFSISQTQFANRCNTVLICKHLDVTKYNKVFYQILLLANGKCYGAPLLCFVHVL